MPSSTPGPGHRAWSATALACWPTESGHYGYVSSRGVHRWPWPAGADESAPLVDGDPGSATAPPPSAAVNWPSSTPTESERCGFRAMFEHDAGAHIEQGEPLVFGEWAVSTWAYHFVNADGSRGCERGIDLWRFRDGKICLKDAYRKTRS